MSEPDRGASDQEIPESTHPRGRSVSSGPGLHPELNEASTTPTLTRLIEKHTMTDLDARTDEIIFSWDEKQWADFLRRYLAAQFPNAYRTAPRPRASIPTQADDDDLVLVRIIHHARTAFKGK